MAETSDNSLSRRTFLGLTSVLTLQTITPAQSFASATASQEFRIQVQLDDDEDNPSRLAEEFCELTKGIRVERHQLFAAYRFSGRENLTLEVRNEVSGKTLTKRVARDFSKGIQEIHRLYAEALRLAVQLAPGEPYLVRALADHYSAFRRYNSGIACFKKLSASQPDQPELQFQLGMFYDRSGRKTDAYAAFRQALHLNLRDAALFYNLGLVSSDLGHKNEAERWFLDALALDPEMKPARVRLGLLRQHREGLRFHLCSDVQTEQAPE